MERHEKTQDEEETTRRAVHGPASPQPAERYTASPPQVPCMPSPVGFMIHVFNFHIAAWSLYHKSGMHALPSWPHDSSPVTLNSAPFSEGASCAEASGL